ncbi:HAD-IA family hydrolase [Luteolibacter pohnpeiensis]|uniref:HAD-IA family hydrolase n=1 Tax=Luteolibacter pohnpeiensis TaxID=454153 RepID=A0A934S385_9BACT|nr:HAD-IA family hydrolase [Luteolibacter pohnpeiensis]MBK1881083.1 HAD-IA family hydrolase [Luteolibacter pohnpeiensis]
MNYQTLIFDFDGTIADTLEESRKIFNEIAPDYGIRQVDREEIDNLRHLSLKELLAHLEIPKRKVPVFIARGTGMMRRNIESLPLIPGIGEVLRELRPQVKGFGILTSNSTPNVELFLESHGLRDLFDFISSTSKLTGKARHLRAIRKTFSLRPEEMLYVGDEIRDIKAARKARISIAAVAWGFNSREALAAEGPELVFSKPQELLGLLALP